MRQPELLIEMLVLRLEGQSKYSLARKYEADTTTIRHWCDKFGIEPVVTIYQDLPPPTVTFTVKVEPPPKYKYQYLFDDEDNVNPGKNYLEYKVASRKRELIRNGTLCN